MAVPQREQLADDLLARWPELLLPAVHRREGLVLLHLRGPAPAREAARLALDLLHRQRVDAPGLAWTDLAAWCAALPESAARSAQSGRLQVLWWEDRQGLEMADILGPAPWLQAWADTLPPERKQLLRRALSDQLHAVLDLRWSPRWSPASVSDRPEDAAPPAPVGPGAAVSGWRGQLWREPRAVSEALLHRPVRRPPPRAGGTGRRDAAGDREPLARRADGLDELLGAPGAGRSAAAPAPGLAERTGSSGRAADPFTAGAEPPEDEPRRPAFTPAAPPPPQPPRSAPPAPAAAPPPAAPQPVRLTAWTPEAVPAGSTAMVDLWVALASQMDEVRTLAGSSGLTRQAGLKAGLRLAEGAVLDIALSLPGLQVDTPPQSLVWAGEPANASFIVRVPPGLPTQAMPGTATLHANGVLLGQLQLLLPVVAAAGASPPVPTPAPTLAGDAAAALPATTAAGGSRWQGVRSAFASYASADREAVLARVQGMNTVAPDLDIFVDAISLRAGDTWLPALEAAIAGRERLLLFWSPAAQASPWVAQEWRWMLDHRGLQAIAPVPLADPRDASPPPELSALHFNDAWRMACDYERLRRQSAATRTPAAGPAPP